MADRPRSAVRSKNHMVMIFFLASELSCNQSVPSLCLRSITMPWEEWKHKCQKQPIQVARQSRSGASISQGDDRSISDARGELFAFLYRFAQFCGGCVLIPRPPAEDEVRSHKTDHYRYVI